MAGDPDPIVNAGPPVPADVPIAIRRPAFQKNMRELASRDPEMQRLLGESAELRRAYQQLRQNPVSRTPRTP